MLWGSTDKKPCVGYSWERNQSSEAPCDTRQVCTSTRTQCSQADAQGDQSSTRSWEAAVCPGFSETHQNTPLWL